MTKKKPSAKGATKIREATKEEIKKLFGASVIGAALLRLCKVCERSGTCVLWPLTTRGEDCPYFKEVKDETNNSNTS